MVGKSTSGFHQTVIMRWRGTLPLLGHAVLLNRRRDTPDTCSNQCGRSFAYLTPGNGRRETASRAVSGA